jgi:agmatinase
MSYYELLVSQNNSFGGIQKSLEDAEYIILGIPFDYSSTYRSGARFGPNAIRHASQNIETYNFRTNTDGEKLAIHDLGNLHISTNIKKTIKNIEYIIDDLIKKEKTPIIIGGEHTITKGVVGGFKKTISDTAIISFDAHLDLRNEFLGVSLSHTTFMRRINEENKPGRIIEVGTRAICTEELKYAKKAGIHFITSHQIKAKGKEEIIKILNKKLDGYKQVYLSIDVDVLDPAFAPAVQNPEPEGISINELLDILHKICKKKRVIGFDVVEISPKYDDGITAIHGAKIIFELIGFIELNT